MDNKSTNKLSAIAGLKRLIFSLLKKDRLDLNNSDKICLIASRRGISQQMINDLIFDCQVEYCID